MREIERERSREFIMLGGYACAHADLMQRGRHEGANGDDYAADTTDALLMPSVSHD